LQTLIIDNYDSFTYNLVQAVASISGTAPIVIRNDELSWEELNSLRFDTVILSPGPGTADDPRDFGICRRLIEEIRKPILGVCLGHQGICLAFGGSVARAAEPMHGRASRIFHNGDPLFADVPDGFSAVRYHSLVVATLPESLQKIAWSGDDQIMAVRHRERPVWGVQFHPESALTGHGETILRNFLRLSAGRKLFTRKLPLSVEPAAVFRTLFAAEPYAFWLDRWEGRFSYFGTGVPAHDLPVRSSEMPADLPFPFQGGWLGSISYEGEFRFVFVERFVVIDHADNTLWLVSRNDEGRNDEGRNNEAWLDECKRRLRAPVSNRLQEVPDPPRLEFAMSREDYCRRIETALEAIRAGQSCEVCLTNQLRGETSVDPLDYYENLRRVNPAPYAAFLRFADVAVACSSPELFLNIARDGHVTSKPIKGTARRSCDSDEDARFRRDLASEKNRAENLMIVDLMRNDLGRVCRTGSVRVTSLMDVETFETVHQMVSTIEGDLRPDVSVPDCIRAAFPPGSMTGAPKIRTMEIIRGLEPGPRGIYSGCIGFLSATGAATFNVVIRTAVFENGTVTIGAGGAIVAQSDPAREWDEMTLKTEALVRAFSGSCGRGSGGLAAG
jgi:para-aminobenzoate synthetase